MVLKIEYLRKFSANTIVCYIVQQHGDNRKYAMSRSDHL